MNCPFCASADLRVIDSRHIEDINATRRRRECMGCKVRFSTLETVSLHVQKRSGVVEPFLRQKIMDGVMKACRGRPVTNDDLARLAQKVEESIRSNGVSVVKSHDVGLAILPFLRNLDPIAYLRFASVYRAFTRIEDFEDAIYDLKKDIDKQG